MMDILYKIDFLSDWLCTSGLSGEADIQPLLDYQGFPYIPGKTIKGLIREGAEWIAKYRKDASWQEFIVHTFGERTDTEEQGNNIGSCHFSNVELSKQLKVSIVAMPGKISQQSFFREISSTALDKDGQAKEHSLRKIQVVAPIILFGKVTDCPQGMADKMKICLKSVKRLGMNRNRGYGRCIVDII